MINPFIIISRLLPKASLGRKVVFVVIGDAITFSSTLVTAMILARIIPINDMGTYRQVLYLAPLVQSFIQFNVDISIYRYWNLLDEAMQSTLIKMTVVLSVALGILASVILIILAPLLSVAYNNPDLKVAMLVTCVFPIVNNLPLLVRPTLICKGYSFRATFFQTIFSLVNVFSLIIPFYLGFRLNDALAIWMIASGLFLVFVFVILKEQLMAKSTWWDKNLWKEMWGYLWPIQVAYIPGYAILYTDKIATSIFLSKQAFAAYSLGARELPFIGTIGHSVSNVMIPRLVEDVNAGEIDRVCKLWYRSCESTAILTYPIAGFCVWFALPVVLFLFSSTYSDSSIPFAVFSAITFIRVIEFGSLAKAYGLTKVIMQSSFMAAGLLIVLSFPMTYFFQIRGIALCVFFSVLMAAVYQLWAYVKFLKRPLSDFFPWKKLLILAGFSIASAAIAGKILDPFLKISDNSGLLILGLKLICMFAAQLIFYAFFLIIFRVIDIRSILTFIRAPKAAKQ